MGSLLYAPLFFVDACTLAKLCQKRMVFIDVFDFTEMLNIFQFAFPKICSDYPMTITIGFSTICGNCNWHHAKLPSWLKQLGNLESV